MSIIGYAHYTLFPNQKKKKKMEHTWNDELVRNTNSVMRYTLQGLSQK